MLQLRQLELPLLCVISLRINFSFRKGTGSRAGRIAFRQEEKIKLPAGRRGIGPK